MTAFRQLIIWTALTVLLSGFAMAAEKDVVFVVESGTRRVKIEIQDETTGRWETHRILHLPGRASQVKVRLQEEDLRRFRVLYSQTDAFPFSYYKGRKAFGHGGREVWESKHGKADAVGDSWDYSWRMTSDEVGSGIGPAVIPADVPASTDMAQPEQDTADTETTAEAVESDIWKVEGNILYFFNQNRGLQIYDLTTPWAPERMAYLRMPALGEQMYVLDDQRVVLLLRRPRELDGVVPGDQAVLSNSEVVVVDWADGSAKVISRTSLPGKYLESRMVGRRLYAVCNTGGYFPRSSWGFFDWAFWRDVPSLAGMENLAEAYLSTLDLSFPDAPVMVDEKALPTRAREVAATGTHFLVVRDLEQGSWYSRRDVVDVFRIYDHLPPVQLGTVKTGGRINDKFKMQVHNGIITTVSQAYRDRWWGRHTLVETFNLPTDGGLVSSPLDSVTLAENETLHATRFDGSRLYVVTFRQIDPLFVVDLADPQDILVHGELEIPGWSTYLIPRGDRLLSVGVENTQVAVSIFDVSDPANPTMADRIFLGEPGQYASSEANWDEKAVGYLPEQDVLLVPYEVWDWDWGTETPFYKTAMQKIKIVGDDLQKAGEVPHEVRARRATMLGSLLASISGEGLLVADLRDPDKPSIVAREQLSWPVHRIYRVGDYQLELEKSSQVDEASVLRLVHLEEPDKIVQELELPAGILADVVWQPGVSRLACLLKRTQAHYVYYSNSLKSTTGLDEKRDFLIVHVDCRVPGQMHLLLSAEFDLTEDFWTIQDLEFFHKGSDWLGVRVQGNPPLSLKSDGRSKQWQYYEDQLAQMLLAVRLLPDDSLETLSRTWDYSDVNPYRPHDALVFAEGRWLFSQAPSNWLRIYDFDEPRTPVLASALDIPSQLKLQGANEVSDAGAALYFTTGSYNDWWFGDLAFRATPTDYIMPDPSPTELFAALYDGAELYFLDDSLEGLDFESVAWGQDDFLIKDSSPDRYHDYGLRVETEESASTRVWKYQLDVQGNFETLAEWEFPGRAYGSGLRVDGGKILLWDQTFLQWADLAEPGTVPQWTSLPQGPYIDFSRAWHEPGKGFHVPVSQYGVEFVAVDLAGQPKTGKSSSSQPTRQWTELSVLKIKVQELTEPGGPRISEGGDWAFQPIRSYMETGLAKAVESTQDGWYELGSFGRYYTDYHPWVYHENLGWLYMEESGGQDGFWTWRTTSGQGWLWTAADTYPFCYSAASSSWVYFYEIPGMGLWRYDFGSASWLSD